MHERTDILPLPKKLKLGALYTLGHNPQQTYLSQHGSENHVSQPLGEDLAGFAKHEALGRPRTCHKEGNMITQREGIDVIAKEDTTQSESLMSRGGYILVAALWCRVALWHSQESPVLELMLPLPC